MTRPTGYHIDLSNFVASINDGDSQPRCVRSACERCHIRKVRCVVSHSHGEQNACSNCKSSGETCIPRLRKRHRLTHARDRNAQANRPPHPSQIGMIPSPSRASPPRASPPPPPPPPPQASLDASNTSNTTAPPYYPQGGSPVTNALFFPSPSNVRRPVKDELHRAAIIFPGAYCHSSQFPESEGNGDRQTYDAQNDQSFTLSEIKYKVLELYEVFKLPPAPVLESLIEAYYDTCWTWMPVLDHGIRYKIAMLSSVQKLRPLSLLLLYATLLAGSRMRQGAAGFMSTKDYYTRAKALLDVEAERNSQRLLAALCMFQWWNPSDPRDLCLNSTRFWVVYAIGIAQQIGLHVKPKHPRPDEYLLRRIWWTLYARDGLIASAHGKPRVINPKDCTLDPLSLDDFPEECGIQGLIFIHYVKISEILFDICRIRGGNAVSDDSERASVALNLSEWVQNLPLELRLHNPDGSPRPHDFKVVQLHALFFATVCILFKPQSIYAIGPENTAAVLASSLGHRVFQAIHLRDQTSLLGPHFSWSVFVLTIPQLSCWGFASLWEEAQSILSDMEDDLWALETRWPATIVNINALKRLRKNAETAARQNLHRELEPSSDLCWLPFSPKKLFETYGPDVVQSFERINSLLATENAANSMSPDSLQDRIQGPTATQGDGIPDLSPLTYPVINQLHLPISLAENAEISFDDIPLNWYENGPENNWVDSLIS